MAERYGAPSAGRRRLLVVATIGLAAVFLGWLAWTLVAHSRTQVSSELESWSVVDGSAVTAVVVVHLADDDVDATCRVRAYAEDHSTVGELAFTPDPAAGRRQVVEIRTDREATAVESLGCTAPGQDRPR
jgi:hypothetical protein